MTDPEFTRTTPSAKAAGKRPAMDAVATAEEVNAAPQSKAGVQTRQKRVLPSRSRRGGPGVGGCDVDIMILETRKRQFDNEPLIPSGAKFLLTTKSSLVPPPPEGDSSKSQLNVHAFGRYFDRPEVQQACKYQQVIQTPEFTQLPDDAIVGGRFRPRGSEDETADTSDAAYEKRHRKYETFEKRQRLREKEKLKHEQYKLKERIEQLRAMDTAAFLALPASNFSEPPGVAHIGDYDETDTGLADLPGSHVNGAAAYNEGERRRKEMLDIALGLEERYRVLLPPDRKWAEKKQKAKRESISQSLEPEYAPSDDPDEGQHELPADDTEDRVHSEPENQSKQESDGESGADLETRDYQRSRTLRLRIKFPPRPTAAAPPDSTSHTYNSKPPRQKTTIHAVFPFVSISAPQPDELDSRSSVGRGANGRFVAKGRLQDVESAPQGPAKKRPRPSSPVSPAPSRHSHTSTTKTPSVLMIAATRNATTPAARKTHRHVTAFGVRVPPELEEIRDYELPEWLGSGEDSDDECYSQGDDDSVSHEYPNGMVWYDHASQNDLPVPSIIKGS